MRKYQKFLFYFLAGMLVAPPIISGCTRSIATPLVEKRTTTAPTASPTVVLSPYPLPTDSNLPVSTPYPHAEQPNPVTPLPTPTATNIPMQNNEPTPAPAPTPLPTLAPEGLADRLEGAFAVQELPATNGHPLLKITGWDYGFRSSHYCEDGPYRWLDETHLLLFPKVGEEEGMGIYQWTWPVVANLDGRSWLPPIDGRINHCGSVEWSQALRSLISSQDGNLLISNLDGELIKRIAVEGGSRFMISPSGGRILVANTWIDLSNGKEVEFNLDASIAGPFYPAWTQDEKRVFNCCYAYLDASSGEARQFELGGLAQAGRGLSPGFNGIESRWVLSDTHSMTLWDFYMGDQWGIVPLFVPEAQAYVDVRDLVGIPTDKPCWLSSISPDGNLIWIQCGEQEQDGYLIDLRSYEKNWFTGKQIFGWSADNQFALIGKITNSDQYIGEFELFFIPDRQRSGAF